MDWYNDQGWLIPVQSLTISLKRFIMIKKNSTHVMFDIETLSLNKNAVIVSIGAVHFSLENGISVKKRFKMNIDPSSQPTTDFHIDSDTLDWWSKQSKEAKRSWRVDPKPLKEVIDELCDFIPADAYIWGYGAAFDVPVIEHALEYLDIKKPWKHYRVMCARTVFELAEININDFFNDRKGVYHDALDDAIFQAKMLLRCFGRDEVGLEILDT